MFTRLIKAIENNLGMAMIAGGLAGLIFPYGAWIPNELIILMLAILIFLSCFRITAHPRDALSWKPVVFCVARYTVLPAILWFLCKDLIPAYAVGILLLALCPAGASSAALTGIYNGNVALAFVITIISNIACVGLIPGEIGFLNHSNVTLDVVALMKTIVLCVLLPGALYIPLRSKKMLIKYSRTYGRLTVVILLGVFLFVVLSKKRDFFLLHPQDLFIPFLLAVGFYAIAITFGFILREKQPERISYGICSTFNNNGLGLGLAILYFDEKTIAILVASEALWCFLPACIQPILRRLPIDK